MSKLLAWGDALFIVRCELGELQVQRVCIDAEEKKVSLRSCTVKSEDEAAALPLDARLVAANEVEDLELAVRYPVLVFLSSQKDLGERKDASALTQSAVQTHRRPIEACDSLSSTVDAEMALSDWLIGCVLCETEDKDEIRCVRLLHTNKMSARIDSDDAAMAEKGGEEMLQVFLVDGPHVLLFNRRSQRATVLDLSKEALQNDSFELHRWNVELDKVHGTSSDATAAFDVVSCAYVSEVQSTRPHMLIHMQERLSSSLPAIKRHSWIVVDMSCNSGVCTSMKKESSKCHYLPIFPSITECKGAMLNPERVLCCCFVSKLSGWNFVSSAFSGTDAYTWDQGARNQSGQPDVDVSTLVVTGTTSNTVYVHKNGILLVSYVLPSRPAEMWPVDGDNMDQHHVLCVRCDDADRSFHMLELRSNLHEASIKLLLSFKHVGFVHIGDFAGSGVLALPQVLLLNDVRNRVGLIEGGTDEVLDHKQLVKRSVLVSQTASLSDVVLSCCRLRLREEKQTRRSVRSRKRCHSDKTNSLADTQAESFRYIERTQKASCRDRSVKGLGPATDGASLGSASHAQLDKLASSLSVRLVDGLQELERLQIITSDKILLVHRLNQLFVQLWQQLQGGYPSNKCSLLMPLVPARGVDSHHLSCIEMETIVSGTNVPRVDVKVESIEHDSRHTSGDFKLEQQVLLEQFNVLEYVPSSSLFHAEVVVKNLSDIALGDSFVVLTAPKGRKARTRGWRCSCSVAPLLDTEEREARYQLEFQFAPDFSLLRERKPLNAMLWLHWNAPPDDLVSNTTLTWHPSESAVAIASVSIDLQRLVGIDGKLRNTARSSRSGGRSHANDTNQLLLISSGSNLAAWFGRSSSEVLLTSVDSVIRPTCALVNLNPRSVESMPYELDGIIASLPPDVYAMLNPFHHIHLRALQRVLRSMRREILITCSRRRNNADTKHDSAAKQKEHIPKTDDCDMVSMIRAAQCNTDFQVTRLLHGLQKRVNFHSTWFDATASNG
uniref:Uncharacterized protein n=1 Tax=Peronospora matthiolae TaxID=2874970 RepID=A0AAV1ULE8_9STRA